MPSATTFPTQQQLTSSGLSLTAISSIFQQIICFILGIWNQVGIANIVVTNGNNQITVSSSAGMAIGFLIADANNTNIPVNTIITGIAGNVLTMSNPATGNATETIFFTDPTAGQQVRQSWPTGGAPAYAITDNVTFVRCVEVDDPYNRVFDNGITANNSTSVNLNIEFTRVWNVFLELRGPTSYDRASLIKAAIQLDAIHDLLASFNLYLVPAIAAPKRLPELFEGQWWERSDLQIEFNEQVNDSTVINTVASIGITLESADYSETFTVV